MKKLAIDILTGLEEALAYTNGDKTKGVETTAVVSAVNVKAVRQKTGLSQEGFAQLFAINTRTLQDWEQQRRNPSVAARIVLALIDRHPATIKKTLKAMGHSLDNSVARGVTKVKSRSIKSSKKIGEPKMVKSGVRKKV